MHGYFEFSQWAKREEKGYQKMKEKRVLGLGCVLIVGFFIWIIGCVRNCFDCFTALSECGGWIHLFGKLICVHADYILEPFHILDYDCFSYCGRNCEIDTDQVRYA